MIRMENFEDMRIMWAELDRRLSSLEDRNRKLARQVMSNKYKTAQDKLINKYKIFIFLSLIMILYISLFICFSEETVEKYRTPALVYWIIFFLFEASIDAYLMYRVMDIDVYENSVSQIAKIAAQNWKMHKIALCLGIPLALGAIILFALLLNANNFTIFGMIIGGIIGFAIGSIQLRKFFQYYKLLQTSEDKI